MLAGGATQVETDQARLCRMALPALIRPKEPRIRILDQRPDADGRGLTVNFTAPPPGGRPRRI